MAIIVNGERIEESQIRAEMERMRPRYQETFTDQTPEEQEARLHEWAQENLIEQVLLRQAALADTRAVPDEQIEERFRQMKEEQGGEEEFYRRLRVSPEQDEDLKQEVALQLRVERLVEDLTRDLPVPGREDVEAYYASHQERFQIPEQIHAAHIVKHVDTRRPRAQAKKIIMKVLKRLQTGHAFEELARQYSDCPENAGDLGWFSRGKMVQEFEDVVFSMEIGQVSGVFQTPFGFHIARVFERRPAALRPLEEVRDEIQAQLEEDRRDQKLGEYLDRLRERAEVAVIPEEASDAPASGSSPQTRPEQKAVKPLTSILVKPAGPDCNLRCTYCFYLQKEELFAATATHRMSESTLEVMIKQVMEQGGRQVNFGWQGGEPSLMGLGFYEKAVEFQRRYGRHQVVGNGFQTNGVLIDVKWAEFFHKHHFLVGLSLDGPEHIHNRYRVYKSGKGSWAQVVEKARLLLDAGVQVNALVVLNDYSARYPQEIYGFHKELGLNFMQFIPCVEPDPAHPDRVAPFSVDPADYGAALCRLFDLWQADFKGQRPTTSIRFFESVLHRYVGLEPPECTLLEECGIYVVVEHNGDVYACDFFVEPDWKLGNIHQDKLRDLLNSAPQEEFGAHKAKLAEKCRACPWMPLCRGGCPKDRVFHPGAENLSYLCPAYEMFFAHADEGFKTLAEDWQREQEQARSRPQARSQPQELAQSPASPGEGKLRKTGRNDPCPCGSGLKYKKCCGRE